MANYNPDFNNTFLFPSTSIAYSPFSSSSSSSLPSYYPSSPSETSASQSSSSLPLLPSQPSSSSVHPYAAAAPAPVSSAASADDGAFGATNIAKSPQDIAPGAEPDIDLRDWRVHLQPDSRQRIVDKIAKTLKRHLPFSSEEGLLERKKIASDYLRKTSLKMLKMDMETIAQDDVANSAQSNSSVCSNELQVQENLMDSSNSRYTAPGGEPAIDMCDWRVHLQHDSRQNIVNRIIGTLKRHLPFSGEEGLLELKKIAERFEEKIYVSAISQSDYLRKISLKMLTMESKAEKQRSN
ncbi:uncharacterized protein LOC110634892 isoform X2 [Hevea brasiliensis]|uniref:uncharacterized protein LOC110634892 isoform X2 n=1 Tax=Hevea brasiliensis TaxID=3981 RepID=UPI0025D21C82|nr:uncharacterized protein LOC110634892 isoform X2 [Hevea brasiliensis]